MKGRVAKKMKKGGRAVSFWMPFGDHFPLKIDEQINAKIDAEKVMKKHEKLCKNMSILGWKIFEKLIVCEKCLMQNNI